MSVVIIRRNSIVKVVFVVTLFVAMCKIKKQVGVRFNLQDLECYRYVDTTTLIKSIWTTEKIKDGHATYTMLDFEYEPTIKLYKNIVDDDPGPHIHITAPAVVVERFDVYNIYEMFHSLLNTYLVIRMFELQDVVIVFNDTLREDSPLNREMFSVFSDTQINLSLTGDRYLFLNGVYKVPVSFTSILSTVTKHGRLRGRSVDHHCKSTLLRDFTQFWIESNGLSPARTRTRITWSSRGVHTRGVKMYTPSRSLVDEEQFVDALRERTGLSIRVVDFGLLSAKESVQVALNTDVLMGVHGAGLMWSAFMVPGKSSVVELFGGDRSANNRHYHNVASLAGLRYFDVKHGLKSVLGKALKWDNNERLLDQISAYLIDVAD